MVDGNIEEEIHKLIRNLRYDNWRLISNLYEDFLAKGMSIIAAEDHLLPSLKYLIPLLKEATRYGLERRGFNVFLTDAQEYIGVIGISPMISKLYDIGEGDKIQLGPLYLKPKKEQLPPLSLKMHKGDAMTVIEPYLIEAAEEDKTNKICSVPLKLVVSKEETKEEVPPARDATEELLSRTLPSESFSVQERRRTVHRRAKHRKAKRR